PREESRDRHEGRRGHAQRRATRQGHAPARRARRVFGHAHAPRDGAGARPAGRHTEEVAMPPDPDRLRAIFDRVEKLIEDRWAIPVVISDVPNPFTGDLDGERIVVDFENQIEDAVFILIHLFGHTVQWNVSSHARAIGFARPSTWTDEQLAEVADYEREAC